MSFIRFNFSVPKTVSYHTTVSPLSVSIAGALPARSIETFERSRKKNVESLAGLPPELLVIPLKEKSRITLTAQGWEKDTVG